jgi:SAM-dependent methyltransferase
VNATAVVRPNPSTEWFASWFDSPYYQHLYAYRGDREAGELIDRLIARLQPAAGAAMLDLGCGVGRHARHLAGRGFDVTGLDLSAASIARARQHEGAHLRFRRQDMRIPFGVGAFDYVFSLFTSFGYFDNPAENLRVVDNIATALRPGGTFVLDYLNVQHAEAHLVSEEVIVRERVTYRISRWTDAGHIFKRIAIDEDGGTPLVHTERVAKLTLADFRYMFALCGMSVQAGYGDYSLDRFVPGSSPRLILVVNRGSSSLGRSAPPRKVLADATERFRRHAEI